MVPYFKKVKEQLYDLGFDITSEDPEEGIMVIDDEDKGVNNLVIDCEDDIVILEQFILELKNPKYDTLKRLLQINRELVHGALTLDDTGTRVIFRDTLQLENLDHNELEASINAIGLMMAEHARELIEMSQ